MRAKLIYEKFTEESDPIRDIGIGIFNTIKKQCKEYEPKFLTYDVHMMYDYFKNECNLKINEKTYMNKNTSYFVWRFICLVNSVVGNINEKQLKKVFKNAILEANHISAKKHVNFNEILSKHNMKYYAKVIKVIFNINLNTTDES